MATEIYHIVPENDLYPHFTERTCPCCPEIQEHDDRQLVIHNSYDGREIIEKIEGELNN